MCGQFLKQSNIDLDLQRDGEIKEVFSVKYLALRYAAVIKCDMVLEEDEGRLVPSCVRHSLLDLLSQFLNYIHVCWKCVAL